MGSFYRRKDDPQTNDSLWAYSERGVLNLAFSHASQTLVERLLDEAMNGKNEPLKNVIGQYDKFRLLTEFHLGNQGFGSPDGGLFIGKKPNFSFVFIEAKCSSKLKGFKAIKDERIDQQSIKGFNSTLQGQLELRWRFVNAFQAAKEKLYDKHFVTEQDAVLPEVLRRGDCFYRKEKVSMSLKAPSSWRRVSMDELKPLKGMFDQVHEFYLLAITADDKRPDQLNEYLFFDREETKDLAVRRIFWLPFERLTDLFEPIVNA